jgi:carbon storage regulator CsrA
MLSLGRRLGQSIQIGDNILVKVHAISEGCVRLSFIAPPEVRIFRSEVLQRNPEIGIRPLADAIEGAAMTSEVMQLATTTDPFVHAVKAQPLKQTASGYELCEPKDATHVRLRYSADAPDDVVPMGNLDG